MVERPQITPHFQVRVIPNEGIFFLSERSSKVIFGEVYELIAHLIDGFRTVDAIVEMLRGKAEVIDIHEAFAFLERLGLIVESTLPAPPTVAAFWSAQHLSPKDAFERLANTSVSIVNYSALNDESFVSALARFGIVSSAGADRTVVFADDYLDPRLSEYNRNSLALERAWMLVKPTGEEIWLGPQFEPGVTGCWTCLEQRLRYNRRTGEFVRQQLGSDYPQITSRVSTPCTENIAVQLAALETAQWIAESETASIKGAIVSLDLLSTTTTRHYLTRRPQCPSCGTPKLLDPIDSLRSQLRSCDGDGKRVEGSRTALTEETFKKFEHHISPITGIINRIERAGGEQTPVFVADHNPTLTFQSLRSLRNSLRSKNVGKGKSVAQAQTSALCEAIERYSSLYHGDETVVHNSRVNLGAQAIDPNDCMLFSESQYQNRDVLNAKPSLFNHVPELFDERRIVPWSPVLSLTHNCTRYLPTAYLYFKLPFMEPIGGFESCIPDTNGNAAGNSIEEAILHGFYELVERDAVAVWWYNRLNKPAIDYTSFDDPYFLRLQSFYESLERETWVLDLTSDLDITVCAAISRLKNEPKENILLGFGAHQTAAIAVERALTEMNQMLLRGPREQDERFDESLEWFRKATVANQPYLLPDVNISPRHRYDFPGGASGDLSTDLGACRAIVEKLGLEMLVLQLTRPDIELDVVKVIVPGLRHWWARFAPGRLFDVPVKMNLLERSLKEDELNPLPMFL